MNTHTRSILSDGERSALFQDTKVAVGLPGRAYYDPQIFEAERHNLLAKTWIGVVHATDIPNPGDVKPITVAGWELIAVRDKDDTVRIFHNICRHRGMKLVKAAGNVNNIRCFYHCWTYNLKGELTATPAVGGMGQNKVPEIDYKELGLLEVRSGQWFDVVFANLDGQAESIEDYVRPFREKLEEKGYDVSLMRRGATRDVRDFDANWKVVIESGIEDYHIPFVHKRLSHHPSYAVELDAEDLCAGFSYKYPLTESRRVIQLDANAPKANFMPAMPKFEESGIAHTLTIYAFPNVWFSGGPDYLAASIVHPLSPEKSHLVSYNYFVGDAATDPKFQKERDDSNVFWRELLAEDDEPMLEVQRTARIREEIGMPVRFSAKYESALHSFQRYWATRMSGSF